MISCSIQLIVETIYQNKAKGFKQNYSANTHNEAANRNNSDLPDRAFVSRFSEKPEKLRSQTVEIIRRPIATSLVV